MNIKNNCTHNCTHGAGSELEKKISAISPDETVLFDTAELLKVFGDSTRIRIIFVLCHGELCVSDIADKLKMTQSAISHQLRVLKQARLVSTRRDGKTIFYSLCDDHVKTIFYHAIEHVME
ncbi:MAG: metalloregulator ArsR/SmtB family transcription factor [Ruminococcus sp.]|nr:metalloregulator ArsR/SmtB family transcription factor [Ruminococcus sp.]MDE6673161.1 metalloregulator ArsR/SmtB family transcription factor [Ruminococcus sp.]MDE6797387.1 metalloregulator ArsR/SmtB family transcription factor [Ruminococcus sp.]